MNKIKAWVFIYLIRPFLKKGGDSGLMDCPMCGRLLDYTSSHGWLHMADGDTDCYGAISHGKGK
jgi:hypothetical protein